MSLSARHEKQGVTFLICHSMFLMSLSDFEGLMVFMNMKILVSLVNLSIPTLDLESLKTWETRCDISDLSQHVSHVLPKRALFKKLFFFTCNCLNTIYNCLNTIYNCLNTIFNCLNTICNCLNTIYNCLNIIYNCLNTIYNCLNTIYICLNTIFNCLNTICNCLNTICNCPVYPIYYGKGQQYHILLIFNSFKYYKSNWSHLINFPLLSHIEVNLNSGQVYPAIA